MIITFVSNFLNHHQVPLSDELFKLIGNNYTFISTERTPDSFLEGGYSNFESVSYNMLAYESDNLYKKALKLVLESDILIIGAYNEIILKFTDIRILSGKPIIKYSERWHKELKSYFLLPYHILNGNVWKNHLSCNKKPVYLLCAGGFVVNDCNLIGAYPNKRFKWGYFTHVERLDIDKLLISKRNADIRILWVGRFIHWKHPELAIQLARFLKNSGYSFQIDMIGSGQLLEKMIKLVDDLGVSDCVNLLGSMSNSKVIEEMKGSHIFLFTSDRQEGWGAVLNEAMSNGCAVVAADSIGAVPYLLDRPGSGLIFRSCDINNLCEKVEQLFRHRELCEEMARNAYYVMAKEWSPENASKNLMKLCQSILSGTLDSLNIDNGPCSKA
jgi:glycosyltransferase involved in cell wall biosynthesis